MANIKNTILETSKNIDTNLRTVDKEKNNIGFISQNILAQLRNFVESVMLEFYSKMHTNDTDYDNNIVIKEAEKFLSDFDKFNSLITLHKDLQMIASHYTFSQDDSERLLMKYIILLKQIKNLVSDELNIDVLDNLSCFSKYFKDKNNPGYDDIIARQINIMMAEKNNAINSRAKFYILKKKPFFVNGKIYYEVTYQNATDKNSKFDRMIAFTSLDIFSNYSVQLRIKNKKINNLFGEDLDINIITNWKTSIRNCEFNNFYKLIFGKNLTANSKEINAINNYLTKSHRPLSSLIVSSNNYYFNVKRNFKDNRINLVFFKALDESRNIVKSNSEGHNVLLYLLYRLNNKIIRNQMDDEKNQGFGLFIKKGCYPFEKMPFSLSLINHNPKFNDLVECGIPFKEHRDEILAREIRNNTEERGQIFTSVKKIKIPDLEELIAKYNRKLWSKKKEEMKLVEKMGQVYINGYVTCLQEINHKITRLNKAGVRNYRVSFQHWMENNNELNINSEKKKILNLLFDKSCVAFVYGAAGTGKTTLIKYLTDFYASFGLKKLVLSQTNTAVNNLKKKVNGNGTDFYTIASYLNSKNIVSTYDLLVIDECSTVSNRDILKVLKRENYSTVLFVGDTFQIRSIRFGNWFDYYQKFKLKNKCKFDLKIQYRTEDNLLKSLWEEVRKLDCRNNRLRYCNHIKEYLAQNNISHRLNSSLFERTDDNEIILCLNYDGLYGINNINSFLQDNNKGRTYHWNGHTYKEGDPIIFNETNRFYPVIYNNMTGKIKKIRPISENCIEFDLIINTVLNGLTSSGQDFELLKNEDKNTSIIRFRVRSQSSDLDEDQNNKEYLMPFQVSYALSIHKAQGLEYNTVKLIIDNATADELNTNIFYTAITRAKHKLLIYWSPTTEQKFLDNLKSYDFIRDFCVFRRIIKNIDR